MSDDAAVQVGMGLTYKLFSMRYGPRTDYDLNCSLRRQFDKTVPYGIQMELTD